MSRYTVDQLVAEIRRQAEQRNATWPCVLLSDLVLLVDEFEQLKNRIDLPNLKAPTSCKTSPAQPDLFQ